MCITLQFQISQENIQNPALYIKYQFFVFFINNLNA